MHSASCLSELFSQRMKWSLGWWSDFLVKASWCLLLIFLDNRNGRPSGLSFYKLVETAVGNDLLVKLVKKTNNHYLGNNRRDTACACVCVCSRALAWHLQQHICMWGLSLSTVSLEEGRPMQPQTCWIEGVWLDRASSIHICSLPALFRLHAINSCTHYVTGVCP